MLKNIVLVGLGGFLGSITRYLSYIVVDKNISTTYPIATFAVNILGSFMLGAILGYLMKNNPSGDSARLFLAVGFCGSFTTFSTFAFEGYNLINQKLNMPAFSYLIGSVILGLLAVWAGLMTIKAVMN